MSAAGTPARWRRLFGGVRERLRARGAGRADAPPPPDAPADGDESARAYRLLAENTRDIIWVLEFPDRLTYVSPACEQVLGWTRQEQLRRTGDTQMLTDASAAKVRPMLASAVARRTASVHYEAEHQRRDGTTVWCEVQQCFRYDESGRPVSTFGITRDISERRKLHDELTRTQKMDLIGTVAGGVAHDFNNFLTVIIGSLELAIDDADKDDASVPLLRDALDAAERSAALTAQMLAFSHHQPVSVGPLDVRELIGRIESVIRRLAGERVRLELVLASDLDRAIADENEVQQMVLNLAINARDAIRGDGLIRIEATPSAIDREYGEANDVAPGRYVVITVTDDGIGMSDAVRRRATDPFFTTKEKGRGTGLGLSMTQRVLDRIGGHLALSSTPGAGTSVRMYLPAAAQPATTESASHGLDPGSSVRGTETVLVVEDEDAVREIACRILRHAGYAVFASPTPAHALDLASDLARAGRRPDLVLSDLVMPGMDGAELRARMRAAHPSIDFVFMSGYTRDDVASLGSEPLPGPLVAKPFHATALLRAVREALGDARSPAPGR